MEFRTESADFYSDITTEFEFTTIEPNQFNVSPKREFESFSPPHADPLLTFLIGGIGITLSSFVGIIGNILCLIVLTRPRMKSSTTVILLGLTVSDLIFVTIAFLIHGMAESVQFLGLWPQYINISGPVVLPPLFGIISTAQVASIYFTVAVTLERFIVVYRPLRARTNCTIQNATRTSVLITGFAILFALPTWWSFSYEDKYDMDGTWAGYTPTVTSFGSSRNYIFYYVNWASLIVVRLIPFTLLTVLNFAIYRKVRKTNSTRKFLTNSESNDISIAKMLTWIVTIFLVCHSPMVYLSMRLAFTHKQISAELVALNGFLLTTNSAVNFIIYCLVGGKFRETCVQLFSRRLKKQNSSSDFTCSTKFSQKSSRQSTIRIA